jgi:hypothetical protein
MRYKVKTLSAFACRWCLLGPWLTAAQTQTTGRIPGTVKDMQGAVIVGAEISVGNPVIGDKRSAVTDNLDRGGGIDTRNVWGNQLNPRANRGLSDFDRTHYFVAS